MPGELLPAPLKGKRVLVTRAPHQSAAMSARIRKYGGEAVHVPLIDYCQAPLSPEERRNWLEAVQQADWVILTSQNSLDFFMQVLDRRERLHASKIAVVGKKTGEYLKSYGLRADFIPETFSAQGLLDAFSSKQLHAERIVAPLGSLSDGLWLEKLKDLGIKVTSCVLYQTVPNTLSKVPLEEIVASSELSAITFASPSAVRFFTELLPESVWRGAMKRCAIAVIGPTTAQVLKALGYPPDVIPARFTASEMIDALANYYSNNEGSHRNEQQS
ncbi:uroporphyrinogen-III synthase [Sporolactobacillus shoreae]|uniref:Uroporphyrinogen-III synthase n=1 Tax=Sporolactobacillus shoreae TaxID=1465501 RepID=A0A4Z0GMC2_9BACL|nr:uroporphyrinogen-III synthase [Sporolactobacillus shoreae]TGA97004.1 uroporphyrinogen-III synthase [Sporolactobacillus shoreae]